MGIPYTYHDGNPEDRAYVRDFWAWLAQRRIRPGSTMRATPTGTRRKTCSSRTLVDDARIGGSGDGCGRDTCTINRQGLKGKGRVSIKKLSIYAVQSVLASYVLR